jgi:hypothetical protein
VRIPKRLITAALGLLSVLVALPAGASAAAVVTPHGVGALQLGATVKTLHQRGLIGGLRKGCELGPGQRVAPLRAPLQGWAIFSGGPRLTSFTIEGGAETGRHIGVGSTVAEARSAYPSWEWLSPQRMYPLPVGLLWKTRHGQIKISLTSDPETHRITSISVPSPNFCE